MRGTDETSGSLLSYVDLEDRVPALHPLRKIRQVVNDALVSLDGDFAAIYADFGRPSIAPERLIRASVHFSMITRTITSAKWHHARRAKR